MWGGHKLKDSIGLETGTEKLKTIDYGDFWDRFLLSGSQNKSF